MPEVHLSRPSDPARDFCQWPYDQPQPPTSGALRQSAILFRALDLMPDGPALLPILQRIRAFWGRFNTVWGLKSAAGRLGIELYFYDYDRSDRKIRIETFVKAFPDLFAPPFMINDTIPFFMCSVEFDATPDVEPGKRLPLNSLDLYTDGVGGTISAGLCHAWDGTSLTLKNIYQFFDSRLHRTEITKAMAASARSSQIALPSELSPGAWQEEIFVFAQKRTSDCVYFSRIRMQAVLELCAHFGFSSDLLGYLKAEQSNLAHHLFDVGIDYTLSASGAPVPAKVGLYGLL